MGPVGVGKHPAVYGHRGGNGGPENSLEAVRAAAAAGADGVEIDIQVLPDNQVVLGHDPIHADPSPTHTARPTTLAELLTTVGALGLRLLVDFKSVGDPAHEASVVAESLDGWPAPDGLIVSSFSVPFLEELRTLAPGLSLMPIVSLRQNFPRPANQEFWKGMSILAAALVLNPLLLTRLRRDDRRLVVWFGATEWTFVIRLMARLGADSLIVADIATTRSTLGLEAPKSDRR